MSSSYLVADNLGLHTVVIDAGHGGKDAGCVSKDKKTYEKTITLEIAQSLGELIKAEYPSVKVIQTRNKDVFVSLNDRADIANKADADLFISIHINSTTSTSPNGFSAHILGQSSGSNKDYVAYNMDVCKRENSVILLEEDYNTKYQGFDPTDAENYIFFMLMQNSYREQSSRFGELVIKNLKGSSITADRGMWPNGFYVLWKTSMPSVLLELGFISNQKDLEALRKKANRDDLAKRIFKAFKEYKSVYDASLGANVEVKPAENLKIAAESSTLRNDKAKPADNGDKSKFPKNETASSSVIASDSVAISADNEDKVFAVQIFATSKTLKANDKEFLGYTAKVIKSGNLNKYYIGVSQSEEEVRKHYTKIKAKYPDSFMVVIENEKVSRFK